MGKRIAIVVLGVSVVLSRVVTGETWYVDGSVPGSGDGTSWETPFKTIQEGIDASSDGDTVIVAEGPYVENIRFNGKNITLTSTDPLDSTVVANTIIDGNQAGSVVTFDGTEDDTCVLSGFTIRNGNAENGGGIIGNGTGAIIQNNIIRGNSAEYGGGVHGCGGVIEGNLITRNGAIQGGGLGECNGIIRNNQILENRALGMTYSEGWPPQYWNVDGNGGGLNACDGTIQGNLIAGNSAEIAGSYASCAGGALYGCGGTIQNNTITNNWAEKNGGGLYSCGGTIQNNTIVFNSSYAPYSYAIYLCDGTIRNCIIWGNGDSSGSGLYALCRPTHCCVQNWTGGGDANITEDPGFLDADGPDDDLKTYDDNDYHLRDGSPCIDEGLNFYWFAWPQSDRDGNCRLAGNRVDMGCYEYSSSSDADGDLLSDKRESAVGTDPNRGDTDGDGLRDGLEIFRGSDPLAPTAPGIIRVSPDVLAIQESLCLAVDGDEIVVFPGIYRENLHLCGAEVILRGSDPDDPEVVAATILHGGEQGPVVWFMGDESEACVLRGFTIRGGRTTNGGGICGGTPDVHTHATIENNVISENYVTGGSEPKGSGGGVAFCDGTIRNNTISANEGWVRGGGLAYCSGLIFNNIVTGNSSSQGGGIAYCGGRIENNVVSKNSGDVWGGGLAYCHGTIVNNTISQNSAEYAGGALAFCSAVIQDNEITANSAGRAGGEVGLGGGLYDCDGIIRNNRITANQTVGWEWRRDDSGELYKIYGVGGGLYGCDKTIENNTVASNSAGLGDGGGLAVCAALINNNVIALNTAENGGGLCYCGMSLPYAAISNNLICLNSARTGGGLYRCGTLKNNTVVSNVAQYGTLALCQTTIQNCIIWGNVIQEGGQLWDSSTPTYSCIQEWTGGGEGNIVSDPRFADPDGPDDNPNMYEDNNYRLSANSPCIDAGANEAWMWTAVDLGANPRISFGFRALRVDMGAYEYPTLGFRVVGVQATGDRGIQLVWNSRPGETYAVWSCVNLAAGMWTLRTTIQTAGETTAWIDQDAMKSRAKFYRIEVE